jgi:hypothetical protein
MLEISKFHPQILSQVNTNQKFNIPASNYPAQYSQYPINQKAEI